MAMFMVKPWYKPKKKTYQGIWVPKTWNGISSFFRDYVYTDGSDIYLNDYNSNMYMLNRETSTWEKIATLHSNMMYAYTYDIWTDGNVARYTTNSFNWQYDYVFDKNAKQWVTDNIGYSIKNSPYSISEPRYGRDFFNVGEDSYYLSETLYKLDKTDSRWKGLVYKEGLSGQYVWADGEKIYYSNGSKHYEYNQVDNSWVYKSWLGLSNIYGNSVWSDGNDMFYSYEGSQYVLDRASSRWLAKTWTGLTGFNGEYIWKDGDHIYFSKGTDQYELT